MKQAIKQEKKSVEREAKEKEDRKAKIKAMKIGKNAQIAWTF